jgi:CRISPR-associated protein Cas1
MEKASLPAARLRTSAHRTLYVDTQGAVVRKRRGRLVVEKSRSAGPREVLASLPAAEIGQVLVAGSAQLTTQASRSLMRRGVAVTFLTQSGRPRGRLVPEYHPDADRRLAQALASQRPPEHLSPARAFARGKMRNMELLLRRRSEGPGSETLRAAGRIEALRAALESAETVAGVRGYEGRATRLYFAQLDRLIQRDEPEFRFEKRSRRPPSNAVNALLGFFYALLQNDAHAGCLAAGLDPYVGLLHRPRHGVPALTLDLMDPFRPAVADAALLGALNRGVFAPGDFEERRAEDMDEVGTYLTKEGRRKAVRAYTHRRTERARDPATGERHPYHRLPEQQARHLARVLTGEDDRFTPFTLPQ